MSDLPGPWYWEHRDDTAEPLVPGRGGWWRIHDELGIEEGPHERPNNEELWGQVERELEKLPLEEVQELVDFIHAWNEVDDLEEP